ncbi:MAG: hypothetical protein QGI78_05665 [Phycisphaerales bacterium]|jgi:hypothetical protein|nr:hypothetical protein [Phycisphaerales bacterium]
MLKNLLICCIPLLSLTCINALVFSDDPCDEELPFCPEDVNEDGQIEIDDVMLILMNYTECGDGTFRPIGDITGDCCVNILDILQIIDRWESSCIPEGACCMDDGSGCVEDMAVEDCITAGGTWHGEDSVCYGLDCLIIGACCFEDGTCQDVYNDVCIDALGAFEGQGTACSTFVCPLPGVTGDECDDAFFAFLGENSFDTTLSTPSVPQPDETQCWGTYLNWDESPDVWFLFVAHQTEWLHFTTCDSDSYDTSIVLYEHSCDNQVSCNGDGLGDAGCQPYYSNLDYEVQAGETYFIRIGGLGGQTGQGTLTIE